MRQFSADALTSSILAQNAVALVGTLKKCLLQSLDTKSTYLSGEPKDREVLWKKPRGGLPGIEGGSLLFRCLKGAYGLVDAVRKWWLALCS